MYEYGYILVQRYCQIMYTRTRKFNLKYDETITFTIKFQYIISSKMNAIQDHR